jgi:hypothetical protein
MRGRNENVQSVWVDKMDMKVCLFHGRQIVDPGELSVDPVEITRGLPSTMSRSASSASMTNTAVPRVTVPAVTCSVTHGLALPPIPEGQRLGRSAMSIWLSPSVRDAVSRSALCTTVPPISTSSGLPSGEWVTSKPPLMVIPSAVPDSTIPPRRTGTFPCST